MKYAVIVEASKADTLVIPGGTLISRQGELVEGDVVLIVESPEDIRLMLSDLPGVIYIEPLEE